MPDKFQESQTWSNTSQKQKMEAITAQKKLFTHKCGFSLVEVMIVVVIIGILATLAYPSLERYLLKTRQTEAQTNLMAVYTAQKIYYASNQSYASSFNQLGVTLASDARYTYQITTDGKSYTVTAQTDLDGDATLDVWTINDNKELLNTTNDVVN